MGQKTLLLITLLGVLSLVHTTHIELPLVKGESPYGQFENYGDLIDEIDASNFLAKLSLGKPSKDFAVQVEMGIKDVCLAKHPKEELLNLGSSSFNLKLDSSDDWASELNQDSTGILGLSLDNNVQGKKKKDKNAPKDQKFLNQLVENKAVSNSVFYFEFDGNQQSKVMDIQEYLGIKGKLTIGDYPYNVSPAKYEKSNEKTAKVLQVLKTDKATLLDESSNSIVLDMEKCIGCGSCVRNCDKIAGQNVLAKSNFDVPKKEKPAAKGKGAKKAPAKKEEPKKEEAKEAKKPAGKKPAAGGKAGKGGKGKAKKAQKLIQTTTGLQIADTNCISCGQCTLGCPKAAIREVDATKAVSEVLKNKNGRVAVTQIAPAIRINMAEALGVPAGTISEGKLVTALKLLGFDYVFDTNFSADMTIVEEATELLHRLNDPNAVLPMFTSCCPAWINYVEKSQPELIPHLSSCRSPLSMLSSVIKNVFPKKIGVDKSKIYNVAIMPCTAKKDEIRRPQFEGETDEVLTSRELAAMIKKAKINFKELEETKLDSIYSEYTGGGAIFCASGGVMEAAVRAAHKFITGKDMNPLELLPVRGPEDGIKVASVDINGIKVNVAVAQGIKNAMDLLEKVKNKEPGYDNLHFIEVMACPGGCVVGGGSPKAKKDGLEKRIEATYELDKKAEKRVSQDNDQLNKFYKEDMGGEYGSHEAHHLLHTYYTNRRVDKTWGLFFKQVSFNHTSVSSYFSKGVIKVENNFITAPESFLPVLKREFLNLPEFKGCKVENSDFYQYVVCDDSINVEKFPKLEFYSDELQHTFALDGKDLFVHDKEKKQLLFLVLFNLYNTKENTWDLGLPFIKKEQLYFDLEKETLGVCASKNVSVATIMSSPMPLWSVILVVMIAFGAVMYFRKNNKVRKPRTNELVEDCEYTEA